MSEERVPRWKQREAIRARGGRRRSGHDASAHRPERASDDGCVSGHPALFGLTAPAFELGRMPEGGGYPNGFIEVAGKLMGCQDLGEVIHLCSGSVTARYTFDLRPTSAAAVRADVRELPIRSNCARWVMADPPYDQEYAEVLWGMGKQYPTPTVLLTRVGTWGVTTGTGYRIRALTVAERTAEVLDLFSADAEGAPA